MNWLPHVWFGYWWPSIRGNAPEDFTSLVIVAIVTGLFVPRVRRWWVVREQALHAKLDHNAQMLKHVIFHHPDIPPFDPEHPEPVAKPPSRPRKARAPRS